MEASAWTAIGSATSTSAVVLAPSVPPDEAGPRRSESDVAMDVPPPPAQMGAVLADFETAAPHRFPMPSTTTESPEMEDRVAEVPRPISAATRRWSPLFWIGGVAAGVLVAVGIVRAIALDKSSVSGQAASANVPAAPAPEIPVAPVEAIPHADEANGSPGAPTSAESRTRTSTTKPSSKTVRSPAATQQRGASSPPRKPCGKSAKPCK
jgi:hypothetical protein